MTSPDIFVVGTARTAIGTFGGALTDVPNIQLATIVFKAALDRSGVASKMVGHVVMGNVIPTAPKDAYLSRVWRNNLNERRVASRDNVTAG